MPTFESDYRCYACGEPVFLIDFHVMSQIYSQRFDGPKSVCLDSPIVHKDFVEVTGLA